MSRLKRGDMINLTPNQKKILREYEEAVLQMAYLGSAPAHEREFIKFEYTRAKRLLIKQLSNTR